MTQESSHPQPSDGVPQAHDHNVAWVAGATGLTGSHLVSELRTRGWTVYAHIRPDSAQRAYWEERVAAIGAQPDTTPWHEDAITARFAALRPHVVFAMLGTTKKRAKTATSGEIEDTYQAVDYGLTSMLIRAASHTVPDARFVYLSALGVTPSSNSPYMRARAMVEQELEVSPLDYRIIRPAIIAGDREEKRTLEALSGRMVNGFTHLLRAVGATQTSANLRTRTGQELAIHCADAAIWAPPRSALTGAELDALATAHTRR